jgi:hypothetical protein
VGTRRLSPSSAGFWLLLAAVLVGDAAITLVLVDDALPFVVSILGFALVAIANGLMRVGTGHKPGGDRETGAIL